MNIKNILLWASIALMVLFAYFQWNDPDPHVWIPLYLIVAYLGYAKMNGKFSKSTFFVAAALYLLWGVSLFPPQWEGVMLDEMGMKTLNVELGRETFGLVICSVVLATYGLID